MSQVPMIAPLDVLQWRYIGMKVEIFWSETMNVDKSVLKCQKFIHCLKSKKYLGMFFEGLRDNDSKKPPARKFLLRVCSWWVSQSVNDKVIYWDSGQNSCRVFLFKIQTGRFFSKFIQGDFFQNPYRVIF